MNFKLIVLILIINFNLNYCLEISCWGIFKSNSYRREVLLDNTKRLKDPKCLIITRSVYLFFESNSTAFCPSYVKNSENNRKLLGLYDDDKMVHYSNDKNDELLNHNYCKTIGISSNFDLNHNEICKLSEKIDSSDKRKWTYCKGCKLKINDTNFYFSKYMNDPIKECNLFVSKVDIKNGFPSIYRIKIGQSSEPVNKIKIFNITNRFPTNNEDKYILYFYRNILESLDDLDRLEVFQTIITEFIANGHIDLNQKIIFLEKLITLFKDNKNQFKKDNNYKLHNSIVYIIKSIIEIFNEKYHVNDLDLLSNWFGLNQNDQEYLNDTSNIKIPIIKAPILSYDILDLPESNDSSNINLATLPLICIAIVIIYLLILIMLKIKTNRIEQIKQLKNVKNSKELENLL